MRPLLVIVLDELGGEMVEVALPQHDEVVQAFVPARLDEPLVAALSCLLTSGGPSNFLTG